LNKNTGSIATQTLNLVFNNSGVVNVYEGTLALANSGTTAESTTSARAWRST